MAFAFADLAADVADCFSHVDGIDSSVALFFDSHTPSTFLPLDVRRVNPCQHDFAIFGTEDAVNGFAEIIFGVLQNMLQAMSISTALFVQQSGGRLKDLTLAVHQS